MARIQRLNYKDTNRSKSNSPLRQFLILMLTVIVGVLVSVSVNAQSTSENKEKSEKKKTKLPYKKKNRARANFYASTETNNQSTIIAESDISAITSLQLSFVREMVAVNVQGNDTSDFEIATLVFKVTEKRLAAVDINPLLIAVEFARHGRNIVIKNNQGKSDSFDLTREQLEEIRTLMYRMGVPADRVSVQEEFTSNSMTASGISTIDFHVI